MTATTPPKTDVSRSASSGSGVQKDERYPFTPLNTKLYLPPLQPAWISRPRLLKRMDEGFVRKFTLISAPAGFGKTTLLVEWIHQKKIPVAWLSVDQKDNDPV